MTESAHAPPAEGTSDAASVPTRSHDRIYGCYVSDDADLIGHVAYSLYKQSKVAFIESIQLDEKRQATSEEVAAFRRQAALPVSISQQRAIAEKVLVDFTSDVLKEELEDREIEFKNRLTEELKKPRSFVRAIFENLIANILALVLTAALLFAMFMSKYGFWDTIQRLRSDQTTQPSNANLTAPSANSTTAR